MLAEYQKESVKALKIDSHLEASWSHFLFKHPYGFGIAPESGFEQPVLAHLKSRDKSGKVVVEAGGIEFFSRKLFSLWVDNVLSKMHPEAASQAKTELLAALDAFKSQGADPSLIKRAETAIAAKIQFADKILTDTGLSERLLTDDEKKRLKGLDFCDKSGNVVWVMGSFIQSMKAKHPAQAPLAVELIKKAIYINNEQPPGKRKTTIGLTRYLSTFISRSPAATPFRYQKAAQPEDVQAVYECYRSISRTPAKQPDASQFRKISERLENGYQVDQLIHALKMAAHDPWIMSEDQHSPGRNRYQIHLILTNDRIDRYLSQPEASPDQPESNLVISSDQQQREADDIQTVFEAWKQYSGSPASKPDAHQSKAIQSALETGFSINDLLDAIQAATEDDYIMSRGRHSGSSRFTIQYLMRADTIQPLISHSHSNTVNSSDAKEMAIAFALKQAS